jgi:hypothetical protein
VIAVLFTMALVAPDPLLDEVVAGHRANLDRARTLSAVYTVKLSQDGEVFSTRTFRYVRDLNGTLMREGVEGRTLIEFAVRPGEVRQLTRVWGPKGAGVKRAAAARTRDTNPVAALDLWRAVGGTFTGNDLRQHDLATVLAESDPPARAERDTRDGVSLVRVASSARPVRGPAYRAVTWFDPARGYCPIRVESELADGKAVIDRTGLTELTGGVWLPARCVSDASASHGHYVTETVVTELRANGPLPDGGSALPLPPGTTVKDELRGTEYVGRADWTPAGPERKWEQLAVGPPADTGSFTGQSEAEPVGWSRWLLVAAAGVQAVGLGGLAARKVLARRAGGRP